MKFNAEFSFKCHDNNVPVFCTSLYNFCWIFVTLSAVKVPVIWPKVILAYLECMISSEW